MNRSLKMVFHVLLDKHTEWVVSFADGRSLKFQSVELANRRQCQARVTTC